MLSQTKTRYPTVKDLVDSVGWSAPRSRLALFTVFRLEIAAAVSPLVTGKLGSRGAGSTPYDVCHHSGRAVHIIETDPVIVAPPLEKVGHSLE